MSELTRGQLASWDAVAEEGGELEELASRIQVEQAAGGAGDVLLQVEGLTVKTPRGERALVQSLDLQVCKTMPSSLVLPHAHPRLVVLWKTLLVNAGQTGCCLQSGQCKLHGCGTGLGLHNQSGICAPAGEEGGASAGGGC